jgi:lysophospholipase L1-like esterase
MTSLSTSRAPGQPPSRFFSKAGLVVAAIGVAFGLCELGARMIFPRPPIASREPQIAFLYDPEIRYVMAPTQKGWIDDGLITVNALGFRGPEVLTPKPQGRFRVVIVGDSLTMGWGVADDETYSARLARLLHQRFPNRDLDVVNLGIGGYNTRQEVTLLARNVSRLEPDLVLVGFYSNDVPDTLEDNGGTVGGGALIAAGTPTAGQRMRMKPTPTKFWDRQLRKSRAVFIAGRAFNRLRGAGEWGMSRFAMEIDMLQGKDSAQLDQAWRKVGTQFERLHALAKTSGFAVGVVTLPCREQVMGEYLSAKYQTRIRAMAEPLNFHVIDPLPLMSEHRQSDLFIPYDRNHPSAEGHALIAQAIAGYLDEHQLVAPASKSSGR